MMALNKEVEEEIYSDLIINMLDLLLGKKNKQL